VIPVSFLILKNILWVQGGISNGETVIIRVAFKPTSTIGQEQHTVTRVRQQEFFNIFAFDCMKEN
jgi:chorismate synthase